MRYNGDHCRDRFIFEELGPNVQWIGVCPELGAGMGVPRETVHLQRGQNGLEMVGRKTGTCWNRAMEDFATGFFTYLRSRRPHGFILKKKSPSCGMERVPQFDEKGARVGMGSGLFAQMLLHHFPHLPVEEEGRLNDTGLRENFIVRVYAYARWQSLLEGMDKKGGLVAFHTQHKYLLRSHNPEKYRRLGRIVAGAGSGDFNDVLSRYGELFMSCLRDKARRSVHVDVLFHLLGFLKNNLSGEDKKELIGHIEAYRHKKAPLSLPLVLMRHHFRKYEHPWVEAQYYLEPYPDWFLMRHQI